MARGRSGTRALARGQDGVVALLRRFWYPAADHFGVGVTAFSVEEATQLAQWAASQMGWRLDGSVVEDVDIRTLDQNHVIPNMGVCSNRGVWFPALQAPQVG
jgi:hypothetical protein